MVRRTVAGPESDLHGDKRVSAEDGRGLYTFTDCEMLICRSAQLSSYTGARRLYLKTEQTCGPTAPRVRALQRSDGMMPRLFLIGMKWIVRRHRAHPHGRPVVHRVFQLEQGTG